MKLNYSNENGNILGETQNHSSNTLIEASEHNNVTVIDNIDYSNRYKYDTNISSDTFKRNTETCLNGENSEDARELVYNLQYKLDNRVLLNNIYNLEGIKSRTSSQIIIDNGNAKLQHQSMEDRGIYGKSNFQETPTLINEYPRGIVNPNYPGFQHFAHTLENYPTNIEHDYNSENDMTDDDIDIENADISCKHDSQEYIVNMECTATFLNNNKINQLRKNSCKDINKEVSNIPDLLKSISNNNNQSTYDDFHCTDTTDIEHNFDTRDIIGDFNKEIEDEIKQVLNYNINIQDDLEELRKDIQDNFTKPIESTINNISDVVNHVIKKLVETQCEVCDNEINHRLNELTKKETNTMADDEKNETYSEIGHLVKDNTSNSLVNFNDKIIIDDVYLSGGKDEINVDHFEIDTEKLTNNFENTIRQLSTELRSIIPKLDKLKDEENMQGLHHENQTIDNNTNNLGNRTQVHSSLVSPTGERSNDTDRSITKIFHEDITSNKRHTTTPIARVVCSRPSYNASVRKDDTELGNFDVYNIETALPQLDIDVIESHLKAAKDAERRKRNDREEIRKRLATGIDNDEYYSLGVQTSRPGRKPSLQSRLQSGKNLQICFMNETASDYESQWLDFERSISSKSLSNSLSQSNYSLNNHPYQTRPLSVNISKNDRISTMQSGSKLRPTPLSHKKSKSQSSHSLGHIEVKESDFFALQATLQTEARIALAQAKEMARLQMERTRRDRAVSPVTELVRRSVAKAGAPLPANRRRLSRHLLTDMNVAQLQVIVNELHGEIEALNESLVQLLMARDDLHMGQDAMLVDIEDLTRYLGVKEQSKKTKVPAKTTVRRLASLVRK